ncbi:MAG: hypothetical protein ABW185_09730, partial [Sedimenticola sp.]
PAAVHSDFENGNFFVKRSARVFNQVDPDQAQEWLNGVGKKGGGIVGITKTASALCRWTLSYNMRSHIAEDTYAMYNINSGEKLIHNESTRSRQVRDNADENALLSTFERFGVFTPGTTTLQNIATKDIATVAIQDALLNAKCVGQMQLQVFVQERLAVAESDEIPHISLYDAITKSNAPTFATLYDVKDTRSKDQKHVMKADRSVLQRLITAYEAGRPVDMPTILEHELMPVPLSLAELNGTHRTGNKSILADILTENIDCPEAIELHEDSSCIIIDGQALVVAIGKPSTATNFGDLADIFVKSVIQTGSSYNRIDIVFDRYREMSIKSSTRARRTKSAQPIRRVVENREVPLPKSWDNFMALPANKADLARFLSEELLANPPVDKVIVVAGGFVNEREARASHESTDLSALMATHEEADTRLILHAVHTRFDTVVVNARDTDVLLLLVSHFPHVQCKHLFMMAGTSKKRKYIPIDRVYHSLPQHASSSLLPFHALTGCDTTSYVSGHTKRSSWKVFKDNHELLVDLGVGELTNETAALVETFMCRIYNVSHTDSIDTARYYLFSKSAKPEALPPTSDALRFHVMRVNYQTMIWRQACCAAPELPAPDSMGWKCADGNLVPILMSRNPIPAACLDVIACSCNKMCGTLRCKCRKSGLRCTISCRCKSRGDDTTPCMNL